MKNILNQILEIYFLGGSLEEILSAVDEYRNAIYARKIEHQMFSRW